LDHGARLNKAIMKWASSIGMVLPQHSTNLGYSGPFIEDHFREEFYKPVRYRLSAAEVLAWVKRVQGTAGDAAPTSKRPPNNKEDITVKYPGAPIYVHDSIFGGGGRVVRNQDVLDEVAKGVNEFFLEAPYDPELFHPWVPLFIPWESTSLASVIAATVKKFKADEDALRRWSSMPSNPVQSAASRGGNMSAASDHAGVSRSLLRNIPRVSGVRPPEPPNVTLGNSERKPSEPLRGGPNIRLRTLSAAAPGRKRPPKPSMGSWASALEVYPHLAAVEPSMVLPVFVSLLKELMRPDVYYITVTQRPAGPWLESVNVKVMKPLLKQTLVFSSGGFGHIPIPLLGRELPLLSVENDDSSLGAVAAAAAAAEHTSNSDPIIASIAKIKIPSPTLAQFSLSLIGNRRAGSREKVHLAAKRLLLQEYIQNVSHASSPSAWVKRLVDTRLALAPRGVGSTSFRLYEALQLGIPPVYTYDGLYPWLPYAHPLTLPGFPPYPNSTRPIPLQLTSYPSQGLPQLPPNATRGTLGGVWARVGYVLHDSVFITAPNTSNLTKIMPELAKSGGGREEEEGEGGHKHRAWWRKRRAIEETRDQYFTYSAVLKHIRRFLKDPFFSELYCSHPVPPSWESLGVGVNVSTKSLSLPRKSNVKSGSKVRVPQNPNARVNSHPNAGRKATPEEPHEGFRLRSEAGPGGVRRME